MKPQISGLKASALKLLMRGEVWIPRSEIDLKAWSSVLKPTLTPVGEHWFFYSPNENIALRRLGPAERFWPGKEVPRETISSPEAFEKIFGETLIQALVHLYEAKFRMLGGRDHAFRWVFAESDGIPGVLVDVFGDVVVAKFQNQAAQFFEHSWRKFISQAFLKVRGREIVFSESNTQSTELLWNGFRWTMNPGSDQKTGAYFDQRLIHVKIADLAQRLEFQRAWDLCSFQGGFSLHLLKAGLEVLAVDVSQDALNTAEKNVALNQLPSHKFQTHKQDVFDFLRERSKAGEQRELISLDPPSMLKNPKEKFDAARGYLELNLRALKCLSPGGVLATFACSHYFTKEDFERMLKQAAHDARKSIRVLEVVGPSPDHTYRLEFPQGHYFQGWIIQNVLF